MPASNVNFQGFQQACDGIRPSQVAFYDALVADLVAIRAAMLAMGTALDADGGVTGTAYAAMVPTTGYLLASGV